MVTKEGWDWAKQCPVYFRYSKTALPLPEPVKGGSLDSLWDWINIKKEDRHVFAAFLVHYFNVHGPYCIASMIGGPGTAKSANARTIQALLDPTEVEGASMPKSDEDLLIGARERRLPVFDNLNSLSKEMHDNLCRMSTGASHSRRTKYTDCDETTFTAKNPVAITSVSDVITHDDLLDRVLRFILPPLADKKGERIVRRCNSSDQTRRVRRAT